MDLPRFLRERISHPEYRNPNSDEYIAAQKYFNLLYPGTVQFDATGRMIQPEYDMTITEFETVQAQIDAEIEKAKRELERNLKDTDEEPEEENDDENKVMMNPPQNRTPMNVYMSGQTVGNVTLAREWPAQY